MGLEKELAQVINDLNKGGTKPYDTSAVVKRVEGNTAWVHIDQGVEETPVEMTIACKAGDTVKVRLSGGMAYLLGNNTAPPTDDRTALEALGTAGMAKRTATGAAIVANTTEQRTRPAITSMITYYKLSNGTPPQPTEESHAGWSEEEPEWDPESDEQLYYSVRSRTVQGVITWSNPHVLSSYANLSILQNSILLEVGQGSAIAYIEDENGIALTDENDDEIIGDVGNINDAYSRIQIKANEILQEVSETYVNIGDSNIQSLSSVLVQTVNGLDLYSTVNGSVQAVHSHMDNNSYDIIQNGVTVASFGPTTFIGALRDSHIFFDNDEIVIYEGNSKCIFFGRDELNPVNCLGIYDKRDGVDTVVAEMSANTLYIGSPVVDDGFMYFLKGDTPGSGDLYIDGTVTQASDERLKKAESVDIPDMSDVITRVFTFKSDKNMTLHLGYYAQDVEKIAPWLVSEDPRGYKALNYIEVLVAKVAALEAKVKALEKEK